MIAGGKSNPPTLLRPCGSSQRLFKPRVRAPGFDGKAARPKEYGLLAVDGFQQGEGCFAVVIPRCRPSRASPTSCFAIAIRTALYGPVRRSGPAGSTDRLAAPAAPRNSRHSARAASPKLEIGFGPARLSTASSRCSLVARQPLPGARPFAPDHGPVLDLRPASTRPRPGRSLRRGARPARHLGTRRG